MNLFLPMIIPDCGPPINLSPEKVKISGPYFIRMLTGVSSARSRDLISKNAPLPQSTMTGSLYFFPIAINFFNGTCFVKPLTT